ncbi:MAG: DUF1361 domain-containing protein [Candidatus Izemoplasmatales bacterium]|nr:DUF1361 domain-containing protein [Candidatus Izemoplasmatales bacterium]
MISKHKLIFLGIYMFLYILVSPFVYLLTGDGLHVFLIWNIFLASVPLGIMYIVHSKWIKKTWIIALLLIFWLLFYPNSMYLITDLIYLDKDLFMSTVGMSSSITYTQNLIAYVAFFHIFLGAILGILLAVESIKPVISFVIKKKNQIWAFGSVVLISILSSFAIYVGRFFRYNTWDFLNLFNILKDFFESFSMFTVVFIAGFSMIQIVLVTAFLKID